MQGYEVVVVGAGLVGEEMVKVLKERKFPAKSITVLARSEREQTIAGETYQVKPTTPDAFEGKHIAFFAGTEGEKGASQTVGWEAVKRGCMVIDNGDDFRMDDRVPLVVPEANADAIKNHIGFVSNPNCSTIQMVAALAPLNRRSRMRRIVVSTYQSVSGSGGAAVRELDQQVLDKAAGNPLKVEQYAYQILGNLIPQISGLKDEFPGYYGEEIKMIKETRKIFDMPALAVSATCVRVPVRRGHSETINVEFESPITPEEARELLAAEPGLVVVDDPASSRYPMPLDVEGTDETYVGRIRQDPGNPNALDLWVVADNIRKGAATNAVQIAEIAVERGWLLK